MPPISGVSGAGGVDGGRGNEPLKVFSVEVSGPRPSREQVTDAVFRHFGFTRADVPFLKQNFKGVDPFAYFARTLEHDPRSTYTEADGRTMTRVSLDAKDYEVMQKLAQSHHPTQLQAPDREVESSTGGREAAQARQVYDTSGVVKARLQQQATEAQGKDTEGVGAFLEGVVAGDFSGNDSWSATAGKIIGGLNPLADIRDIAAGVAHVVQGKEGALFELGAATLGAVPIVGDAGKALLRGGRKVAGELAEEAVERTGREVAERTARETTERTAAEAAAGAAVRSTPEMRQNFRALFGEARYNEYAREVEAAKALRPELKNIPTEDLVAIRGYTSQDYEFLNPALRGNDAAELRRLEPYIVCARSGLSQLPDYTGVAFRGANLTPAQAAQYVPGEVRIETSFFSTSAEAKAAFPGNTRYVIESAHGKDVSVLSEVPREKEILFPPGTQFRVLAVDDDLVTGGRRIVMREVPRGGVNE